MSSGEIFLKSIYFWVLPQSYLIRLSRGWSWHRCIYICTMMPTPVWVYSYLTFNSDLQWILWTTHPNSSTYPRVKWLLPAPIEVILLITVDLSRPLEAFNFNELTSPHCHRRPCFAFLFFKQHTLSGDPKRTWPTCLWSCLADGVEAPTKWI